MMKSKCANYILAVAAMTMYCGCAFAYSGEDLAKNAKITMDQAIAIAQKTRPGAITDKELEKERGGSGLRYSFDIKAAGIAYEVGVDAMTGAVLENSTEEKKPD